MNRYTDYITNLISYSRGYGHESFDMFYDLYRILSIPNFPFNQLINRTRTPFAYFVSILVDERMSVYDFPRIRECVDLFIELDPNGLNEVVYYLTTFVTNIHNIESVRHSLRYMKIRAEIIDMLGTRIHNILMNTFPANLEPLNPINYILNYIELQDMRQYLKFDSHYLISNIP